MKSSVNVDDWMKGSEVPLWSPDYDGYTVDLSRDLEALATKSTVVQEKLLLFAGETGCFRKELTFGNLESVEAVEPIQSGRAHQHEAPRASYLPPRVISQPSIESFFLHTDTSSPD